MRQLIGTLALCGLMIVMGCRHVGGKCDCGPAPGDAALYTSFTDNYSTVQSAAPETVAPAPISSAPVLSAPVLSAPVMSGSISSGPVSSTPISSGPYEQLGKPKELKNGNGKDKK